MARRAQSTSINRKFRQHHPGIFVQKLMLEKGITSEDVCKYTGISIQTFNNVINGKTRFTPNTGVLIARFFSLENDLILKLQAEYETMVFLDETDTTGMVNVDKLEIEWQKGVEVEPVLPKYKDNPEKDNKE